MKHLTTLVLVSITYCLFGQSTASFYFDSNEYTLNKNQSQLLDSIRQVLLSVKAYNISIEAHTDFDGDQKYNQQLSQQRAQYITRQLTQNNIDKDQISIAFFGEDNPKFSNLNEDKSKNRRVDITYDYDKFESPSEILDLLNKGARDHYTHNNDKARTIHCRKGSKIYIPTAAFKLNDGSPLPKNAIVDITVEEAFGANDIFTKDISTISNDKILETGGSIYINASYNTQPLQLNNKSLEVQLPTRNKVNDMQVFTGNRNASGDMNWEATNTSFTTSPKANQYYPFDAKDLYKLQFTTDEKNIIPKFATTLTYPTIRAKGYKPRAPKRPIKEELSIRWSLEEKTIKGDAYRQAKRQRLYEQKITQYLKDSTSYERKLVNYLQRVQNNKDDHNTFDARLEVFENELTRRCTVIQNYQEIFLSDYVIYSIKQAVNDQVKTLRDVQQLHYEYELVNHIIMNAVTRYSKTKPNIGFVDLLNVSSEVKAQYAEQINKDYNNHFDVCSQQVNEKLYNSDPQKILTKYKDLKNSTYRKVQLERGKIDNYFAGINTLGWINCDRFYSDERPKLIVHLDGESESYNYIVFKKIKSAIKLTKYNQYKTKIPEGEEISLVSLMVKNGQPSISITTTTVNGQNTSYTPDYKSVTILELEHLLAQLNS